MILDKNTFELKLKELINTGNPDIAKLFEKFKDKPEMLESVLGEIVTELYEDMNPLKYPMVSTEQFLNDPYFCGKSELTGTGVASTMYPKLKEDFIKTHSANFDYRETILTGGIGIGKTFYMSLGLVWHLYFLSCLKNPQKFLKLSSNSKISLMIISITEKQAKANMFANVKEMIKQIPYFKDNYYFNEKKATDSLLFPNNVELFSGTSTQSSTIGLNIWCAALDEANFFKVIQQSKRSKDASGEYNEALTLYYSLIRRQESRYLKAGTKPGMLYLGSSKQYPNDFTSKRIQAAKESNSIQTHIMDYSLWSVARERYSKEEFLVELGGMGKRNRILEGNETDITGDLIRVPMDFFDTFKKDLDNSIRDLGGIALYSICPFFSEREKVHEMFDDSLPHIFSVDRATLSQLSVNEEKIIIREIPNKSHVRYVGLDMGLKKDTFGFAMGYIERIDYVTREIKNEFSGITEIIKERRPFVVIEMVLEVRPDKDYGEVEFSRVRSLIYLLKKRGFKIRYSSADGWQSVDTKQILKKNGIQFDYISMDKTTEPYETFRSAVYEGRVRSIYHEKLEQEMIRLEKDYVNDKVDHSPDFSKDVSDAAGQVVYNCHINTSFHDDSLLPSTNNATITHSEQSYDDIVDQFENWVKGIKKNG